MPVNSYFAEIGLEKGGPGREANLLAGHSKHLYCLKDGSIRHQLKHLDPRTCGAKQLLWRYVLLDVDTGAVYGELQHPTPPDLLGFLARALSVKPDTPIHGKPNLLNVPRALLEDAQQLEDLKLLVRTAGVRLGPLGSGFQAGAHAIKSFEHQVLQMARRFEAQDKIFDLDCAHALSAVLSHGACSSNAWGWHDKWAQVPPISPQFIAAADAAYKNPGGWRRGSFEQVLLGL